MAVGSLRNGEPRQPGRPRRWRAVLRGDRSESARRERGTSWHL